MATMADAAFDYGRLLGLAVHPVGPDCRGPLTTHGHRDASSDPVAIRKLWSGRLNANIAAACGAPSGAFILDVDRKGGRDGVADLDLLQARHGALPDTWVTLTPSGGFHFWFRRPGPDYEWQQFPAVKRFKNTVGVLIDGERSGLDVRDTGGSAALPPSVKPSGGYTWGVDPTACEMAQAPAWLLDLIDPPLPPRPPPQPIRIESTERTARYVAAAVNDECRSLSQMGPATGRNQRLFMAAANLGEFVGANLLPQTAAEAALERAASECGLLHEDGAHAVRATIASGMARGIAQPREVRA
jgi:hypothetical protein